MRLKSDLSEEEIQTGFTPQNDIFNRRDLSARLTGLFASLEHGSVCLLDGRWGTGKSTFVRQWAAELKTQNIPSIYFDAFASDYMESPFEAIVGSFVQAAAEAKRQKQSAYKTFVAKAASVGKALAAVSAKVGVRAASLGVISVADLESVGEVGSTITDGLGEISEKAVQRLLESHADRNTQFKELRKSLEALPALLKPEQNESSNDPLIVFIDELDRCRPDFSLGIIEILKHFFRVDRIHFVLVTNKNHLQLSVEQRYGKGTASAEYLEKFYDFVVYFDNSYEKPSQISVGKFIDICMAGALQPDNNESRGLYEYIRDIAIAFRLSLRQIQNLSANVSLAYAAARENEFRPTVLITFLVALKTLNPDLFMKARGGTLNWREFEAFVKTGDWDQFKIDRVIKLFRYHSEKTINANDPEWEGFENYTWRFNIERERVIPYLATQVLDRFAIPFERLDEPPVGG